MAAPSRQVRSRKVDHVAAWLVIGIGSFIVLGGLAGAVENVQDRRWSGVVIVCAISVFFGVRVWRAVLILRRLRSGDQR